MSKRYKAIRRERYYNERAWDIFEMPPCWCGAENPYYSPLPRGCGGTGTVNCFCGGDNCVCHWHGETECFGCVDCERITEEYECEECAEEQTHERF